MTDDSPDLRPARPEVEDERPAYMPKIAWKWVLGIGSFLVLSVGVHQMRERQETDVLRAALLKARGTDLAPVVARYESVTEKVRRHTQEAARQPRTETFVDPRLRLDALGSGKGLYLRLEESQIPYAGKLDQAKLDETPDAIGRCLGLAPLPAGELLARGSFLDPEWIKQAEDADSLMKLRVVAEELKQRSQRDLPFVVEAVDAQWFMLTVERGANRRDAPVDVYLWDLKSDQLLLRTRTQAAGALVSARIAVEGVKPGHYAAGAQTAAAQDCSIASQVRALTGGEAAAFGSKPPSPREAMGADQPSAPAAQDAANGAPTPAPDGAPAPASGPVPVKP
ncbi:MAG: hypothetical protein QM778_33940 [Myxococcales bacterium]